MYPGIDDNIYDIEFMNLVVDKADGLRVVEGDSHFCEFTGIHPSKIRQGKLILHEIILPKDRERVINLINKKDSPYLYFDVTLVNKEGKELFVHCTGHNIEDLDLCRLTLADVSKSEEKQQSLKNRAVELQQLVEMISGGVCLFKVTSDMHIEALYLNEAARRLFGATQSGYAAHSHRIEELIHPDDKSLVFQAIGKAMATDGKMELEFRISAGEGNYRLCKFSAGILKYDEDNTPVFHAVITDISDLKIKKKKKNIFR